MKRGVVLIAGLILLSGLINYGNSGFVQLSQSNHLSFSSNESNDGNISGCTNESANNYNQNATQDDGSCDYDLDDDGVLDVNEIPGCTDINATNYDLNATDDDGTCIDPPSGGFVYSKSVEIFNNTNSSTHGVQSKIKFSNNEDFFAVNDFTNMTIWDSANTTEIISIESSGRILDFDWSSDDTEIVIFSCFYVLDMSREEYNSVYTNWDSTTRYSSLTNESYWIEIYNIESKNLVKYEIDNYTSWYGNNFGMEDYFFFGDIEMNPNGSMIAISYHNNTVIYNYSNFESIFNYTTPEFKSWFDENGKYQSIGGYRPHNNLDWSSSGDNLAISVGAEIKIFDVKNWSEIDILDSNRGGIVSYSPNGELLAQCYFNYYSNSLGSSGFGNIVVTNSSTGKELWKKSVRMDFARCTNIEFSHDSEKLAISYTDMGYRYDNVTGIMIFSVHEGKMIDLISGGYSFICCGIHGFDWSLNNENIFYVKNEIISYEYNNTLTGIYLYSFTFDEELNVVLGCMANDAFNHDSLANRMNYVCDFGLRFSTPPNYDGGGGGGGYGGGTDVGWPALDFSGMGCFGWCPEEFSTMDWIILISVCVVILFVVFKILLVILKTTKTTIKKYSDEEDVWKDFSDSYESEDEES